MKQTANWKRERGNEEKIVALTNRLKVEQTTFRNRIGCKKNIMDERDNKKLESKRKQSYGEYTHL